MLLWRVCSLNLERSLSWWTYLLWIKAFTVEDCSHTRFPADQTLLKHFSVSCYFLVWYLHLPMLNSSVLRTWKRGKCHFIKGRLVLAMSPCSWLCLLYIKGEKRQIVLLEPTSWKSGICWRSRVAACDSENKEPFSFKEFGHPDLH